MRRLLALATAQFGAGPADQLAAQVSGNRSLAWGNSLIGPSSRGVAGCLPRSRNAREGGVGVGPTLSGEPTAEISQAVGNKGGAGGGPRPLTTGGLARSVRRLVVPGSVGGPERGERGSRPTARAGGAPPRGQRRGEAAGRRGRPITGAAAPAGSDRGFSPALVRRELPSPHGVLLSLRPGRCDRGKHGRNRADNPHSVTVIGSPSPTV